LTANGGSYGEDVASLNGKLLLSTPSAGSKGETL